MIRPRSSAQRKRLALIGAIVLISLPFSDFTYTNRSVGRAQAAEPVVDLTRAVIVTPANLTPPEGKAITMLVEEVEKRTQIRWPRTESWPADSTPVIAVGPAAALKSFAS